MLSHVPTILLLIPLDTQLGHDRTIPTTKLQCKEVSTSGIGKPFASGDSHWAIGRHKCAERASVLPNAVAPLNPGLSPNRPRSTSRRPWNGDDSLERATPPNERQIPNLPAQIR